MTYYQNSSIKAVFVAFSLFLSGQHIALASSAPITQRAQLGLHIHRPTQAPWPEFSFDGWRLLDSGVSWKAIQPTPLTFDFNRLDLWVNIAQAKQVDLSYVFYAPPPWASSRPNEPGANGLGTAAEPANIEDWRNYVRRVVTRYKGRIQYYEVWNEPNWKNFYTGSWTNLSTLVKEASLIIREVDPDAKIILPGLASEHGLSVIDDFLATGVGKYVDIIGYHFYTGHRPPEVLFEMVKKLKRSLNNAGLSQKPIWNTEFGWLIEGHNRRIDPAAVGFAKGDPIYSESTASSFIARAYIILTSLGIKRSYYYAWDNDSMGIFDQKSNATKKTLATALSNLSKWLTFSIEPCALIQNTYVCNGYDRSSPIAIVWTASNESIHRDVLKKWSVAEDLNSDSIHLNDSSFRSLGAGPFVLRK